MTINSATNEETYQPEEIAIIGAGLAGVKTALMLARQRDEQGRTKYHITLIEKEKSILNGASAIAARLHLGGEYPLDEITGRYCMYGAVLTKLMENMITTKAPKMKFFIAEETEKEGQQAKLAQENAKKAGKKGSSKWLTWEKFENYYSGIRSSYQRIFKRINSMRSLDEDRKKLFGHPDDFFQPFTEEQLNEEKFQQEYGSVAGGFQSQEEGINIPLYLASLKQAVESCENITVVTGKKVMTDGISGSLGNFTIHYEEGKPLRDVSQVIQAAWQGGPAITKLNKPVTVYKRMMLVVDLPEGWKTGPAFVMLGRHGGMIAPFNDKSALVYLPTAGAAYQKEYVLDAENRKLPDDWNELEWPPGGVKKWWPIVTDRSERQMKKNVELGRPKDENVPLRAESNKKVAWAEKYFEDAKKRFPILEQASNPRVIIRDTLSFQRQKHKRRHEKAEEYAGSTIGLAQRQVLTTAQRLEVKPSVSAYQMKTRPSMELGEAGHFVIYSTKATLSSLAALQAATMVEERSRIGKNDELLVAPGVARIFGKHLPGLIQRYSIASLMKVPEEAYMKKFLQEHPDLSERMAIQSWGEPPLQEPKASLHR